MHEVAILTTVPISIASYGIAVQLGGALPASQAVLFNVGTYFIAACAIFSMRYSRHASLRVDRRVWLAGIELGLWIFAGATLQIWGLQRTTASRAGFLVQLTTIIVPLAEALFKRMLPTWNICVAVALSFAGLSMLVSSPKSFNGSPSLVGDSLVALSALMYSGHILRLSKYAKVHETWTLATAKVTTQLLSSVVAWLLTGGLHCMQSGSISAELAALDWRICFWTGLVTCAYPMWAQGFGQAKVVASQACLIYSTAPVWSALMSFAVLGQSLSIQETAGASLIMVGMLFAL